MPNGRIDIFDVNKSILLNVLQTLPSSMEVGVRFVEVTRPVYTSDICGKLANLNVDTISIDHQGDHGYIIQLILPDHDFIYNDFVAVYPSHPLCKTLSELYERYKSKA